MDFPHHQEEEEEEDEDEAGAEVEVEEEEEAGSWVKMKLSLLVLCCVVLCCVVCFCVGGSVFRVVFLVGTTLTCLCSQCLTSSGNLPNCEFAKTQSSFKMPVLLKFCRLLTRVAICSAICQIASLRRHTNDL